MPRSRAAAGGSAGANRKQMERGNPRALARRLRDGGFVLAVLSALVLCGPCGCGVGRLRCAEEGRCGEHARVVLEEPRALLVGWRHAGRRRRRGLWRRASFGRGEHRCLAHCGPALVRDRLGNREGGRGRRHRRDDDTRQRSHSRL